MFSCKICRSLCTEQGYHKYRPAIKYSEVVTLYSNHDICIYWVVFVALTQTGDAAAAQKAEKGLSKKLENESEEPIRKKRRTTGSTKLQKKK